MKRFSAALVLLFFAAVFAYANDGAFYARGNQLIPMVETSISCQKEILTIKRPNYQTIEVVVYYEFFNHGDAKTIDVGFEATSPVGDVNGTPINGQHPYIYDFTVNMNDKNLPYQVTVVSDSVYYRNGIVQGKKVEDVMKNIENTNVVDFNYVYHFKGNFKKGLNIICHTYSFALSSSIDMRYNFEYVLSAANRWSNQRIDDFTLIIDMGNYEDFYLNNSFFHDTDEWLMNGIGKIEAVDAEDNKMFNQAASHFFLQRGNIVFHQREYTPYGELFLYTWNKQIPETFDYQVNKQIDVAINAVTYLKLGKDEISKKILKNLPFARRGYVFNTPELKNYFERQFWYMPNPSYQADVNRLTMEEQEWLKTLEK